MLLLHDDAQREYAYGPAEGLPDTKVGSFTQELFDEAKKNCLTMNICILRIPQPRIDLFPGGLLARSRPSYGEQDH
jgi:hypothetical protein